MGGKTEAGRVIGKKAKRMERYGLYMKNGIERWELGDPLAKGIQKQHK